MARLLDKKVGGKFPFEYRPAAATNVAETFRRAREQREAEEERQREADRVVSQFRSRR